MERYGTKNGKFYNIFAVITGALILGFLWRVRGTHGWGSSWGLMNVGFIFTLFLSIVAGVRKKMNIFWICFTSASFMFTAPSWGTINDQICGYIHAFESGTPEINTLTEINPWSGVAMMLMMGLGMASLYSVMLGRGYSDKKWEIKHFVIVLAVFFASYYLSMLTLAHPVIKFIQPESVENFKNGLALAGEKGSVYKSYLQHFNDLSWAKKLAGGRNYFSEVQAVSAAIRTVAVLLTTAFIVKDKVAAKIGTLTSVVFSLAITVADLFFYFGNGGFHYSQGLKLPKVFAVCSSWTCWEYFTGFIAGGVITAIVLSLTKKEDISETAFDKFPENIKTVFTFLICFGFVAGANFVRPVLVRYDKSKTSLMIIMTVISLVIYLAILFVCFKKFGVNLKNITTEKFVHIVLPSFLVYDFIVYMFVGSKRFMNVLDGFNFISVSMFIAVICSFFFAFKKTKEFK